MSTNTGYLFYKKLYDGKKEVLLKNCKEGKQSLDNKEIVEKILNIQVREKMESCGKEPLKMKTTYPGLLLGSGYNHDTGLDGDFKLGFFFDYTTGMPIIPGSSLKGLLRSVFPSEKDDEVKREGKREYLSDILGNNSSFEELKSIELDIFEGGKNGKNVPMNKRDIFYDAHIIKGNKKGNILAEDFLCPHEDNPLKNPVPLKMLKILPDVEFQFDFDLKDGIMKVDKKRELFKRILLDFGIGAKTNTGYGQFDEEYADRMDKEEKEKAKKRVEEELKRKEEEKLSKMTEIEAEIYYLSSYSESEENKIISVFEKLDKYEGDNKISLAKSLKDKFEKIGKWSGKQSKKQKEKINKINSILGES